jgi:hypothetical protein
MKTKLLGAGTLILVGLLAAWSPGAGRAGRGAGARAVPVAPADTGTKCPATYSCLPKFSTDSGLGTGGHRIMMRVETSKEYCGWAPGPLAGSQNIICEVPSLREAGRRPSSR